MVCDLVEHQRWGAEVLRRHHTIMKRPGRMAVMACLSLVVSLTAASPAVAAQQDTRSTVTWISTSPDGAVGASLTLQFDQPRSLAQVERLAATVYGGTERKQLTGPSPQAAPGTGPQ